MQKVIQTPAVKMRWAQPESGTVKVEGRIFILVSGLGLILSEIVGFIYSGIDKIKITFLFKITYSI